MAKRKNSYFKAIPFQVPANQIKIDQLLELRVSFRHALCWFIRRLDREFVENNLLPSKYTTAKPSDLESPLSSRYIQVTYSQALESFDSWMAILENQVRSYITHSNLNDHTKTILYRINKRHAWYSGELSLDWYVENNELYVPTKKLPANQTFEVSTELLYLSRRLIKMAKKVHQRPNLSKVGTLKLNAQVMDFQQTMDTSFPYWLKVATLKKGKPIYLPMLDNSYFECEKQKGQLLKHVQLTIHSTNVAISPVIEYDCAKTRTDGQVIGLDWGLNSLFATSNGQLLGQKMLTRLKEWDLLLTRHASELQKLNKPLKKDSYYVQLQKRISSYVKNEIGRLLNKLCTKDVKELVVEKLDFRGKGLSKRMNRLLTRAGRKAVKQKLLRLTEELGVTVTTVNAAYTSQECHRCGYIDSKNRKSQSLFECKCCGHKQHADINAAQNIKGRRSVLVSLESSNKVRKTLREKLLDRHQLCCPSGNHSATASSIGLVGGKT